MQLLVDSIRSYFRVENILGFLLVVCIIHSTLPVSATVHPLMMRAFYQTMRRASALVVFLLFTISDDVHTSLA